MSRPVRLITRQPKPNSNPSFIHVANEDCTKLAVQKRQLTSRQAIGSRQPGNPSFHGAISHTIWGDVAGTGAGVKEGEMSANYWSRFHSRESLRKDSSWRQ